MAYREPDKYVWEHYDHVGFDFNLICDLEAVLINIFVKIDEDGHWTDWWDEDDIDNYLKKYWNTEKVDSL